MLKQERRGWPPPTGKAWTVGAGLGAWVRAGASGAWTLRCSSSRNGLSRGKLTFQVLRPHRVPPGEGRCDHAECSAAPQLQDSACG